MALANIEGYYKMATETKEKLIRVLQLMQTTDEKTPMNATQIVEKLSTEYDFRTGKLKLCWMQYSRQDVFQ